MKTLWEYIVWYSTAVYSALRAGPAKGFIITPQSVLVLRSCSLVVPTLAQCFSPDSVSPGRVVLTLACTNCYLIISPLSEEQAVFSLALLYKYLRVQIPRRKNYLVWYEKENGNFRLRLQRKYDSKNSSLGEMIGKHPGWNRKIYLMVLCYSILFASDK